MAQTLVIILRHAGEIEELVINGSLTRASGWGKLSERADVAADSHGRRQLVTQCPRRAELRLSDWICNHMI
jgi:hypothetical protein